MVNVGFFQYNNISTQDKRWYDIDNKIEMSVREVREGISGIGQGGKGKIKSESNENDLEYKIDKLIKYIQEFDATQKKILQEQTEIKKEMLNKFDKFENITNKSLIQKNTNINNDQYAIVKKPIQHQPKPSVDHIEGEITKYFGKNG